jgi:hypothetical protein
MPEDTLPEGVERGSLEHLLFITLTVAVDYQRDANDLWRLSRAAYENVETRYLFSPAKIWEMGLPKLTYDLKERSVSKKPTKDAWIWRTVALSFHKKWNGNPREFLSDCSWDAPTIISRLHSDTHDQKGRMVWDFPYLRGTKIGPLWLRMLRDNVRETRLSGLENIPIPVDVHVARSTFALGIVRGRYHGPSGPAFAKVREAWSKSARGFQVDGRQAIALDIDEPLWHLSKYGCTNRDKTTGWCPAQPKCALARLCVGGMIRVDSGSVDIQT